MHDLSWFINVQCQVTVDPLTKPTSLGCSMLSCFTYYSTARYCHHYVRYIITNFGTSLFKIYIC